MARVTSFSLLPFGPTAPESCPPWPASMAMTSGRMPRPRTSFRVLTAPAGGTGWVGPPIPLPDGGVAGWPVATRVGMPVAIVVAGAVTDVAGGVGIGGCAAPLTATALATDV